MNTRRTALQNAFGHPQAGPRITCSGRGDVLGAWFFAIMLGGAVWLLFPQLEQYVWRIPFVIPLPLVQYGPTALALAVSLLAALAALRATLRWRKLGPATLTMDPWPAGLGGELGGVIRLAARPASGDRIALTLQCIRRRRTGSGRNRRWQETVLWEDEGLPVIEAGGRGARLVLRFPLPGDQPASDTSGNDQIHWRLYLVADLGRDHVRRNFTVPVNAQADGSTSLTAYPLTPSRPVTQALPPQDVREIRERGGTTFLFPAFRNLRLTLSWATFGLAFFGLVGGVMLWLWLTGHRTAPPLAFPVIFLLIGSLMVLPVLWLPFSLRVFVTPESIIIRRRWMGIPVGGRRLNAQDVRELVTNAGMQTRTGTGHHQVRYHLLAHTHDGRKIRCGAGLAGQSAIRLYEARFRQALGMQAV